MTTKFYPFNFNPKRVIERYGGVNETYRALSSIGADVTPRAVRKWLQRGTVPAEAIVALHLYDQKNDAVVDLFDPRYRERK